MQLMQFGFALLNPAAKRKSEVFILCILSVYESVFRSAHMECNSGTLGN